MAGAPLQTAIVETLAPVRTVTALSFFPRVEAGADCRDQTINPQDVARSKINAWLLAWSCVKHCDDWMLYLPSHMTGESVLEKITEGVS
jgi:hypothetical protein